MTTIHHAHRRYYQETDKTVEQCASHGDFHGSVGWGWQIDPRWNDAQVAAYVSAFDKANTARKAQL